MDLIELKKKLIGRTIIVSKEPILEYAKVNDIIFNNQHNDFCVMFENRGFVLFLNLEKVKEFNTQIEL